MNTEYVFAVIAAIFRDDQVLALRRAPTSTAAPGSWEAVGGRVEDGEEPIAAMEREINEETGLRVDVDPRPIDVFTTLRGEQPMVVVFYRAAYRSGEVSISAEHSEHRWCEIEEFARLTPFARLTLAVRRAAGVAESGSTAGG